MIGIKLYACLFIAVVSWVKCIDASCLKYGHSCWGAHGKRSNVLPREIKFEDDILETFKIPKSNEKLNPLRFRYPVDKHNLGFSSQMFPKHPIFQQYSNYDDGVSLEKIIGNVQDDRLDENEEFQQKAFSKNDKNFKK